MTHESDRPNIPAMPPRRTVVIGTVAGVSAVVLFAVVALRNAVRLPALPEPRTGTIIRGHCPPEADSEYFFPGGIFWNSQSPDPARVDGGHRAYYSSYLRSMGEPSLSCGAERIEVYRFLYLRSFHGAVSVRVVRTGDEAAVHAIELSPLRWVRNEFTRPTVKRRLERTLTQTQWQALVTVARNAQLSNLSTVGGPQGDDGAMWIIEKRDGPKYNVVERWSPKGAVRSFGMHVLDLSGLSIPESERQ